MIALLQMVTQYPPAQAPIEKVIILGCTGAAMIIFLIGYLLGNLHGLRKGFRVGYEVVLEHAKKADYDQPAS